MPARPWKTSFTGGELTEQLDGRVDLARYQNGARCLVNVVVRPHGGAARRAGSLYIAHAKISANVARLWPFVFSRSISYMLEFGNEYLRVYVDRAPLRAASTNPAYTLTLSAATGYGITITAGSATFTDTNTDRGREVTNNTTTGRLRIRTVTSTTVATADVLVDFDDTSLASGQWTFTGAHVEIATPYVTADLRALRFEQVADVLYIVHPSYAPRKLIRLTATTFQLTTVNFNPPPSYEAGHTPATTLTLGATSGNGVTANAGAVGTFLAGDVGRVISSGPGGGVIRTVVDSDTVTLDIIDAFSGTSLASGAWTIEGSPIAKIRASLDRPVGAAMEWTTDLGSGTTDVFRSTDVGRFIKAGGGVVEIYQVPNAYTARAVIVKDLVDLDVAAETPVQDVPGGAWTLESETWTSTRGYPGVVRLADQRLYFMGSTAEPDRLWGSRVNDYENHATGSEDDAAIDFAIGANQQNQIRWAVKVKRLLIGTLGGEYLVQGPSVDEPITPTGIQIQDQSKYGCDFTVDALPFGQAAIFLQRGKRRIREMAFSFEADGYLAPDLLLVAEHLARTDGVVEMTYASSPDSYLLPVNGSGQALCCAYEKLEQVSGWSHFVTGADQDLVDGRYESIAAMPNMCGTGDEVWTIVQRVIDGATHRYVEVFDGALTTDAAVVYSGSATDRFRGLSHLQGETVYAIDKTARDAATTAAAVTASVSAHTVASGEIEQEDTTTSLEVGLLNVPQWETLRPELTTGQGSLQGRKQRVDRIVVRVYCALGDFTINGQVVRYPAGATFPYTGDVEVSALGWDRTGRVTIEHPQPLPLTVLAVGLSLGGDDG